jgi:hypothetical protein
MEANVGGGKWRPIAEGLGRAEPTGSDLGIKQGGDILWPVLMKLEV